MKDVVIVSACCTAIGAFGGSLRDSHAAWIAAAVMNAALQRAKIEPSLVDDVRFGCCMEPADALNVTRVAALLAGAVVLSTTGCGGGAARRDQPAAPTAATVAPVQSASFWASTSNTVLPSPPAAHTRPSSSSA